MVLLTWSSLNPNSELAKRGLERLERIIKGQDPDKEEDQEEDVQEEEDDEEFEAQM